MSSINMKQFVERTETKQACQNEHTCNNQKYLGDGSFNYSEIEERGNGNGKQCPDSLIVNAYIGSHVKKFDG
jgi:hypothetical protein